MKKAHSAISNPRLKAARELRGWTQKYVADQLGADHYYLSRWEHGIAMPSPYYRQQLCELFGLNARELGLLGNEDGPDAALVSQEPQQSSGSTQTVVDPAIAPLVTIAGGLRGRATLLSDLRLRLQAERGSRVALNGLPGVGKTALAANLVSDPEVRARFPNGVLWASLGPQPDILKQLQSWGDLLGLALPRRQPASQLELWTRAFRTAMNRQRLLLVIDDAWTIDAALALCVGGRDCAYILTTRQPMLASQFTRSETTLVPVLPESESVDLLRSLVPQLTSEAAGTLAHAVGGLPLALFLIGHYLLSQATGQPRRLQAALERLSQADERLCLTAPLALLERPPGLQQASTISVEASIALSVARLTPQACVALQALAGYPVSPASFSEEEALAVSLAPAEVLDSLTDAGLLSSSGAGRYTLHPLIADYARILLSKSTVDHQQTTCRLDPVNGLRYA